MKLTVGVVSTARMYSPLEAKWLTVVRFNSASSSFPLQSQLSLGGAADLRIDTGRTCWWQSSQTRNGYGNLVCVTRLAETCICGCEREAVAISSEGGW